MKGALIVDTVARLLEEELARQGVAFSFEADTGHYVIQCSDGQLRVSLDTLRRAHEQDDDPGHGAGFVENFEQALRRPGEWAEERSAVTFVLEPSHYAVTPPLRRALSERVDCVPVYSDPSDGRVTWLDDDRLDTWRISLDELTNEAFANLARHLSEARLECFDVDGVTIGYFETDLQFQTSLLLAPNLKHVVAPVLGWPLFAVIPDRNFVYLWNAAHDDMLERVGDVVIKEFEAASHPLTTEVFRISDDGIEAIGAFSTD